MLSKKAQEFIEHNKGYPIYKAGWLDKDGRQPSGDPKTWIKFKAWFGGRTTRTLSREDLTAINESGIKLRWITEAKL